MRDPALLPTSATPRRSPNPACAPERPSAKRPGSLHDRLAERDIADLITADHEGVTTTPSPLPMSLTL
jgi:hypothetical protein